MQGEIRQKLDAFIRRYYLNQLVRGALLGFALLLGVFLFLNLGEYYGHFSTPVRAALFWGFWLVLALVFWNWIFRPLAGLYGLGKVISYATAAQIIGSHFASVKDKLLNLLQLEQMAIQHPDSALLLAGIDQKSKELKPIPFVKAVNLGENRKYLRFVAVPVLMLGVILVFQSSIITDGAERIVNYNRHYAQKAPFEFVLLNKKLASSTGGEIELELALKGKKIPEEVYLNFYGQEIKMAKNEKGNFAYTLKNLKENGILYFAAAGYSSREYKVLVNPIPAFTGSEARVIYPAYTGKLPEKFPGTADFLVPEGSKIEWTFDTRDATLMQFSGVNENAILQPENKDGRFYFAKNFFSHTNFTVLLKNPKASKMDTAAFHVSVIQDQRPGVFVEKKDDSLDIHQFYFVGNATDDYGVNRITFNYRFINSEDPGKLAQGVKTVPLRIENGKNDVTFYYILAMNALGMAPSDEVEYYFEAWDNDGIHGSKSTRTQPTKLRRQSADEARKEADMTASNVKNLMQDALKSATQLQKQSKQLQDQINRQKNMNWDDKSKIQDLLEKQSEIEKQLENIQKENEKLKQQKEEFQKNDEFQERQKQLDELFKQMQDPEIKKLMDEIQKLLEKQASKEQLKEKLNQLEDKNRDWAKDMDKLMEQYKQLQMEQKLTDNIERLEKLAEKEEALAEKTKKAGKEEQKELQAEQQKLKEELKSVQQDIKEIDQMNKELKDPMDLKLGEEQNSEAQSEMGEAEKNMEKNKNEKASENQKNAAEKMKEAAQKMKESLESEKEKRMAEDYQKIRELLENLVETSFNQESIFMELRGLRDYNPKYLDLNKRQMALKAECAMIEDSLRMLARRQPMISTFVTREITRINTNMGYALDNLKERQLGEAAVKEQFVMTGLNNLAVMLMESMENMQQQMAQKQKSKGSKACNNPNNSGQGQKSSGKKLSQGQQQLGERLQKLQKQAQQQREGQQGQGGKDGQREMNKEYAKMALMQEALRRQVEEMRKELEKQGPEGKAASKELQKTADMMEQQERDLVNKRITPEMIRRQKEIETRMLEHEKAQRNQQQEDKREANQPGNHPAQLPPSLELYMQQKKKERELLRLSPPELAPYYKEKSKEYLRTVQ